MKTLACLILMLILLLLGSGCQHLATSPLAIQEKFFQSLQFSNPKEERALRCAQYHNLVGRYDLALQELSHAVASDPHNVRLLNAMANCYDKLEQYSRAQEVYEKILAQNADDFLARNNLGYSCYLSGNWSRAEKIFQEILAKNPEYTVARNNLGLVWCRQGKESQALSLWQKSDGDIPAREKLSQVLAYLGKPGNQAGNPAPVRESQHQAPVVSQTQAEPPEKKSLHLASTPREPNLPTHQLRPSMAADLQEAKAQNPKSTNQTSKRPQEPQVTVEEVKMIVTPAAATQTASEETMVKEITPPSAPPGQEKSPSYHKPLPKAQKEFVLADNFLPDDVPVNQYYRRPRQWHQSRRPKIINCQPEPPKNRQSIKKILTDDCIYQMQNKSGPQEPCFY